MHETPLVLHVEELAPPTAAPAKSKRWPTEGLELARRYLDAYKARDGAPSPYKFNAAAEVLSRFVGRDPDRVLAAALAASVLTVNAVELELKRGQTNGSTSHRVFARGGARS